MPEAEQLHSLAGHRATLVIYLSVQQIEKVVAEVAPLLRPGYSGHCGPSSGMAGTGFPGRHFGGYCSKVKSAGIRSQAIILIGEVFGARGRKDLKKSKLYDESFEHGFRQGQRTHPEPAQTRR